MPFNPALIPAPLRPIAEKVQAGERISDEDAVQLYKSNELNALGAIANIIRERKNGNVATYILNRYINYSNICILSCQFCAFGARKRDPHAFEYALPEIVQAVKDGLEEGITEVHMVGGLHPTLTKEWYIELLTTLRALDPALKLKAFTAIEIRHLADRVFKLPIRDTLETLREAGLNAITGGGAEIFDQGVRDQICRGKENADEWLEVHRTWHKMGQRSTCTMLFGHIETHRAAGRSPPAAAGVAGRDGGLYRLHPVRLCPGDHGDGPHQAGLGIRGAAQPRGVPHLPG